MYDGNIMSIPPPLSASLFDFITNKKQPKRSRRGETRPLNGTLTLRRPSTTPFAQSASQGDVQPSTPNTETPAPQLPTSIHDQPADTRFTKNQLLDIYKTAQEAGELSKDISHLYVGGWDPSHSNGANGRASWGKSSDSRDSDAAAVAWEYNATIPPIGLEEPTEEEKIVGSLLVRYYP